MQYRGGVAKGNQGRELMKPIGTYLLEVSVCVCTRMLLCMQVFVGSDAYVCKRSAVVCAVFVWLTCVWRTDAPPTALNPLSVSGSGIAACSAEKPLVSVSKAHAHDTKVARTAS